MVNSLLRASVLQFKSMFVAPTMCDPMSVTPGIQVPLIIHCHVKLMLTQTEKGEGIEHHFVLSCVFLMVHIPTMVTTDQYHSLTAGPWLSFSYQ